MATLTLSVPEQLYRFLKSFPWVNWSEISREEAYKKLIFDEYLKTGTITDDAWEFCEKIDWHPVDELPLKDEFVKKMEAIRKEKPVRFQSVAELFRKLR